MHYKFSNAINHPLFNTFIVSFAGVRAPLSQEKRFGMSEPLGVGGEA